MEDNCIESSISSSLEVISDEVTGCMPFKMAAAACEILSTVHFTLLWLLT